MHNGSHELEIIFYMLGIISAIAEITRLVCGHGLPGPHFACNGLCIDCEGLVSGYGKSHIFGSSFFLSALLANL